MPDPPPVLLTRPRAQSDRFAAALRARFGQAVRVTVAPLIAPRWIASEPPGGLAPLLARAAGMIFTSETGVEGFRRLSADACPEFVPGLAWCVGPRTAAVARAAGFRAVSAGGDAESLVALLTGRQAEGPLVHARGREARGAVAARLTAAGIETSETIVYAQEPVPLSPGAAALLAGAGPVLAPLFSPRSAALFAAAAGAARAPLWLAAISRAAADEAAALAPARLAIAPEPSAEGMMAAVAALIAAPAAG